MKWMLFLTVMNLTEPVKDVPAFDTESGCLMAKHSIEVKLAPDFIRMMRLSCLKVGASD